MAIATMYGSGFRYTQVGADHKPDGQRLADLLARLLISFVPISDGKRFNETGADTEIAIVGNYIDVQMARI
jgi:hypothetical protein